MILIDLFEELCRQLDEDTKIKSNELFGNADAIQFRRLKAVRTPAQSHVSFVSINNYSARLTLSDDTIDCEFRRDRDAIDTVYLIKIEENQIYFDNVSIWAKSKPVEIPELSKRIIDKLLDFFEKQF